MHLIKKIKKYIAVLMAFAIAIGCMLPGNYLQVEAAAPVYLGGTPEAPPSDFLTAVKLVKVDSDGQVILSNGKPVEFDGSETLDISTEPTCALWFEYQVPAGTSVRGKTYQFEVVGAPVKNPDTFRVYDNNNKEIAKASPVPSVNAAKNTVVSIEFINEAHEMIEVPSESGGVEGYFWFTTSFDSTQIDDGEKKEITITIPGSTVSYNGSVGFGIIQPKVAIAAAKNAVSTSTPGEISWSIVVEPTITDYKDADIPNAVKEITLTDLNMPSELTLVPGSVSITPASGTVTSPVVSPASTGENGFSIVANASQNSELLQRTTWPFTVSFKTTYSVSDTSVLSKISGGNVVFKNTAHAEIKTYPYKKNELKQAVLDTEVEDSKLLKAEVNPEGTAEVAAVGLTKEGKIKGNNAVWKMTAKNGFGADNCYLYDELGAWNHLLEMKSGTLKYRVKGTEDWNVVGTPLVHGTISYSYTPVNKAAKTTAKLIIAMPVGDTREYEFTYETSYVSATGGGDTIAPNAQLKNKAYFYHTADGKMPPTGEIWVDPPAVYLDLGKSYITKSGTYDRASHELSWEIAIPTGTYAMSPSDNLVITDTYQPGKSSFPGGLDQEMILTAGVPCVDIYAKAEGSPDSDYTLVGSVPVSLTSSGGKETGFVLTIDNATLPLIWSQVIAEKDLKIKYKTLLTTSDFWGSNAAYDRVFNEVKVESSSMPLKSVTVRAYAPAISTLLTKENKNYESRVCEAEWRLTVNGNHQAINTPVVTDVLSPGWDFVEESPGNYVTVKQYVGDTLTVISPLFQAVIEVTDAKGTHKVLTVQLPDFAVNDREIYVLYKTRFSGDRSSLMSNESVEYPNTAHLTAASGVIAGGVTAESKAVITGGILSKQKVTDTDYDITWKVDLNKNYSDIVTGDKDVTLVDVLQQGLEYQANSVVITGIRRADGSAFGPLVEGTDFLVNYERETRTLEIQFKTSALVPNSKKLQDYYEIVFKTDVLYPGQYSNDISLKYVSTSSGIGGKTQKEDIHFGQGFAKLRPGYGKLIITKTGLLNGVSKKLKNVRFDIYLDTQTVGVDTPYMSLYTDAEGKIETYLPPGNYQVVEAKLPNGSIYKLDSTVKNVTIVINQTTELEVINYPYIPPEPPVVPPTDPPTNPPTPPSTPPKTGDDFNLSLMLFLAAFGIAGFAVVTVYDNKKKKNRHN